MAKDKKARVDVISGNANGLFTWDDLRQIREHPHILGHLAGYNLLTEMHSEWIKYIWDTSEPGTEKVRALQAHRGSYKTVSVTCVGSVWSMLMYPERTIMIVRKSFSESVDTVTDIAKMMKSPIIRELFMLAHGEYPEFRTERIGDARLDFTFRKKPNIAPSILGMGANSPFTGKHCHFLIVDDLVTLKSRLSKAESKHDVVIWRELITAVLNQGSSDSKGNSDSFARYVGTPWTRDGVEALLPSNMLKFDVYTTGIINEQQLEAIRRETTPILFALNYELRYANDDSCLFADIKYANWNPENQESPRAHIDMAYTSTGDTTALTIGARNDKGELILIGKTFFGEGMKWLDTMADILRTYKVRTISTEVTSDRGWTVKELRNRGFSVKDYNESTKKQHKIAVYGWELWPRIRFDPTTDDEYLTQLSGWTPETRSLDDAPDSMASLIRAFFSTKASSTVRWEL